MAIGKTDRPVPVDYYNSWHINIERHDWLRIFSATIQRFSHAPPPSDKFFLVSTHERFNLLTYVTFRARNPAEALFDRFV